MYYSQEGLGGTGATVLVFRASAHTRVLLLAKIATMRRTATILCLKTIRVMLAMMINKDKGRRRGEETENWSLSIKSRADFLLIRIQMLYKSDRSTP